MTKCLTEPSNALHEGQTDGDRPRHCITLATHRAVWSTGPHLVTAVVPTHLKYSAGAAVRVNQRTVLPQTHHITPSYIVHNTTWNSKDTCTYSRIKMHKINFQHFILCTEVNNFREVINCITYKRAWHLLTAENRYSKKMFPAKNIQMLGKWSTNLHQSKGIREC